ncbi:response regulator transcription factor [Terriglobus roseus]|uniref:Two component transcriptional regulator, winged helix family n=1 Tax=Terriglobus roseus TaxID=392734 RepID=A0A1H4JBR6_9BACT|nr:response regulator transcription factor [Terriglobus roseus]SEB43733.1 two component transcriptional regulator, winged helix family [Terriglobus roseus]
MHQGSVLIVEDDTALRHTVASTLGALGFEVRGASNGEIALDELRNRIAEVVLLDLNMPGMGGMQTAAKMRSLFPSLGIIVLTVRDRDEDKIQALDAGADDYVTKPFRLPELAARIRAAVRRARKPADEAARRIDIGEISLDLVGYRVTKAEQEVHLTPKEFELLHVLMQHAGSPMTHQKLLSTVWGPEYGNEREYLRTYISQLRRKLEDNPSTPQYLLTENYIGYRFQLS